MPLTYALITPSFRLDYEQCVLLTESVRRWVPSSVRHYLVIDRKDVPLFRWLSGPNTRLLVVEDVVPWWIMRLPGVQRFWWSWRSRPIKNWILQQIVKLSIGTVIDEDVLLSVDSDVFFCAPYDPRAFERDGRVPLFVQTGLAGKFAFNDEWHGVAARLLGLPDDKKYDTNFIGNVVCWRRANVLSLHRRVADTSGRPWQLAIAPQSGFSEYILYGVYAERVLGDASGHYPDDTDRTLCYWDTNPLAESDLRTLRDKLTAAHHSVMISAKSRTSVENIRRAFR